MRNTALGTGLYSTDQVKGAKVEVGTICFAEDLGVAVVAQGAAGGHRAVVVNHAVLDEELILSGWLRTWARLRIRYG